MKRRKWLGAGFVLLLVCACENLSVNKEDFTANVMVKVVLDKTLRCKSAEQPNVGDFIFVLRNEHGRALDSMLVREMRQQRELPKGVYTMEVYSHVFERPEFDRPLYSACDTIEVSSSDDIVVSLICTQTNAGVRVQFDEGFEEVYGSDYFVSIRNQKADSLIYTAATADAWGYFEPGLVKISLYVEQEYRSSIMLPVEGRTKTLVRLTPEDIVVSPVTADIGLNTSVEEQSFSWKILDPDMSNDGSSAAYAFTVGQLQNYVMFFVGTKVWAKGYVVSGKIASGKVTFGPEGAGSTHIALAPRPDETESSACISVGLPTSPAEIRQTLSVANNPSILGRQIWVYGEVTDSYLGLKGIDPLKKFKLSL